MRLFFTCCLQVTKQQCGSEKGCYSEPEDCTNSSNCVFLVTYKVDGDNISFEMSGKHGYVAVGFNSKQQMVSRSGGGVGGGWVERQWGI